MIKLKGIKKIYKEARRETKVLNEINIEISKGDFLCIYGKSGCGKSTLLNILGLMENPTSGEYWFQDLRVSEVKNNARATIRNKEIGFIFQGFHLIQDLNVLDNISLPMGYAGVKRKDREEKARYLLKQMNLTEREKYYPNQLSGGEKQRVAIGRALANNPQIILADEPTGSLDEGTGKMILQILKGLNEKGHTIVLVTHDKSIAKYANRSIKIEDGIINAHL